jgi:hypothetical protein
MKSSSNFNAKINGGTGKPQSLLRVCDLVRRPGNPQAPTPDLRLQHLIELTTASNSALSPQPRWLRRVRQDHENAAKCGALRWGDRRRFGRLCGRIVAEGKLSELGWQVDQWPTLPPSAQAEVMAVLITCRAVETSP